jgi:uncharacterized protein (DUF2336 family)
VAKIVIGNNKAFDDADLAYIVEKGGPAHRASVAHRRDVGPSVASAIGESGDTAAMKVLLENATSKLSERAVDLIVTASRKAPELCPLLIQREEVRPAHALAMFWWSAANERRQILLRFSAERSLLIDMCADIFRYSATDTDPVVRKALQVIERRQRNRAALISSGHESLEAAITLASQKKMDLRTGNEIATLAGVKPSTGQRIFLDPGGEGVAVLCKATGLKRQFLRELWLALDRDPSDDNAHFRRVSEVYESIAVAKAQTVLRYWNWSLASAFTPDQVDETDDDTLEHTLSLIDDALRPKVMGQR